MSKIKLSCPNQDKIDNRRRIHPCLNCKWYNRLTFQKYGLVRFACDYPDGVFLQYSDGAYCFRSNYKPLSDIKEGD